MRVNDATRKYFESLNLRKDYWRKKNRFYHDYVASFTRFLVPEGKQSIFITNPLEELPQQNGLYEYIVLSDVLGYVADVEDTMHDVAKKMGKESRIIITQYNALWEPIIRLASLLRLRVPLIEQNWLSRIDLQNFLQLAGLEPIRTGTKILVPKYIPLISTFFNKYVANIWPFSKLGLMQYVVARKVAIPEDRNPSISIVVPARNEAGTIERIVHELPMLGSMTELIFIEGNSKDNTLDEIKRVVGAYAGQKKLSYAVQSGKGKGDAVRKGFEMATGDILAIYDADMTVPADEMVKFYRALAENRGEFINGSRLVYPMEKESMRVLNFLGNKFFSFAFSSIIGQPIKDTLCGTKVLWRKDYEDIKTNRKFFGDFDPFGDFDLLFGAVKLNRKIIDMPVHYKERVYGTTNISRWKHGWLLLKMTVFAAKKLKFF